jgi:hypothetical protein
VRSNFLLASQINFYKLREIKWEKMKSEVDLALEELMILQRSLLDCDDADYDLLVTSPRPDYLRGRNHSNTSNIRGQRIAYDNNSQRHVDGKSEIQKPICL